MRDAHRDVSPVVSANLAARAATVNGAAVDLLSYGSAMVLVPFGTWTDGTHTPKIQESDNGTSGWTDVAAADRVGAFAAVSSGAGSNTVQRQSYIGGKRYVRAVITVSGGTTGAVAGAMVLRGHPASAPTAA